MGQRGPRNQEGPKTPKAKKGTQVLVRRGGRISIVIVILTTRLNSAAEKSSNKILVLKDCV